jgi:hypothetical protein
MLRTLEGDQGAELKCGSHMDILLGQLATAYRDRFIENCLSRGILGDGLGQTYTLRNLSDWLQVNASAKRLSR